MNDSYPPVECVLPKLEVHDAKGKSSLSSSINYVLSDSSSKKAMPHRWTRLEKVTLDVTLCNCRVFGFQFSTPASVTETKDILDSPSSSSSSFSGGDVDVDSFLFLSSESDLENEWQNVTSRGESSTSSPFSSSSSSPTLPSFKVLESDEFHFDNPVAASDFYFEEYEYYPEELDFDVECWYKGEEWEKKYYSNKWARRAPMLRERRVTKKLRKQKVKVGRYVKWRNADFGLASKFGNQRWPKHPTYFRPMPKGHAEMISQSSSSRHSSSTPYYAPYQATAVADATPYRPSAAYQPAQAARNFRVYNDAPAFEKKYGVSHANVDVKLREVLNENPLPCNDLAAKRKRALALLIELQTRDITPEDYDLLLILDETVEKKTVEKGVLESIPTVAWVCQPLEDDDEEGQSCCICMCEFEEGNMVSTLPACKHEFHKACIEKWLSSNSTTCPLDGMSVK